MPKGDIGSVIVTRLLVSNNLRVTYNCIKLSAGKYMMAFKDNDSDGRLITFGINESTGNVTSVIRTWEFLDGDTVNSVKIIKVSGTTYAIVYSATQAANIIRVRTFTVSDAGIITESFISSLTLPVTNDEPQGGSDIIHISGDVYAIVYSERDSVNPSVGVVVTVTIDSTGIITAPVIDSLDFAAVSRNDVFIVRVGTTDFYAIAYTDNNQDPVVVTVSIDSAGTIAAAVTDTQVLANITGITGNIVRVPGTDFYAVVVDRSGTAGTIYTCSINSSGAITNGSNGNFDVADAENSYIVSLGADAFLVVYRGVDNDGFLASITIDSAGAVGSVLDSLEFKTVDVQTPFVLYLGSGNYAVTYGAQAADDVECVTVGVATGLIYPTDAITRVTGLIHRYDSLRGVYQLEVSLGDVSSLLSLPDSAAAKRATHIKEEEKEIQRIIDDVRSYGFVPVPPQFQPPAQERPEPVGLGPLGRAAREEQIFMAPRRAVPSEQATRFTFPGFTRPGEPVSTDKVTEEQPLTLVQPGALASAVRMFRLRRARPVSIEESTAKFERLRTTPKPKPVGVSENIRRLMRFR